MSTSRQAINASFAAWVSRKTNHLSLTGSPDKVKVVKEALIASRNFRDELCKESANFDDVTKRLNEKREAARKFELLMGYSWPL